MEEGEKESYRVVWGFGPRTLLTVEYSRKQQQWCIEQDRSGRGSKSIERRESSSTKPDQPPSIHLPHSFIGFYFSGKSCHQPPPCSEGLTLLRPTVS